MRPGRKGSVLMEFIMVCPIMVILVSMILQFSQIWIARQITAYAAYCATRAVLSAQTGERDHAAQKAAELVCAWMSLAGRPGSAGGGGGSSETVLVGRYHDRSDISDTETVYFDDGAAVLREIRIPGWGTIPGSDSAEYRVKTFVDTPDGVARVRVEFKFPLLLPLAGRMISCFVNQSGTELDPHDYGSHELTGGNNPAWNGEEAVMDESGNIVDRSGAKWGEDGRFPAITLTETCVLPMRYTGDNLYPDVYNGADLPKEGGS